MNGKIRELRRRGYSFREIADRLELNHSTVWSHANDIQFSDEGYSRYRREVSGITKEIPRQRIQLSPDKARVIGHLIFDGTVCSNDFSYVIRYINSSERLISQFKHDFRKVYDMEPSRIEEENTGQWYKITYKSKRAYQDLLTYTPSYSTSDNKCRIPKEIMEGSSNLKLEVLRAFWQDEGSITSSGRLMAELRSEKVIYQIKDLIESFDLEAKVCDYRTDEKTYYKLYLPKKESVLERFQELKLFKSSVAVRGDNKGRNKSAILSQALEK